MPDEKNLEPFFILGSGRSGSTLLRLILSGHPNVTIPPETHFIMDLVYSLPVTGTLGVDQLDKAVNIIINHYRWPDMKINADDFKQWAVALKEPTIRSLLDLIYEYFLKVEGKKIWGDKTPNYIKIVPQLSLLYPDAKFIYLVRDGRDVIKSFQTTGWYGPWLFANTKEWKEAVNHYIDYKSNNPELNIMELKYEDLVLDTENVVKKICGFLNLDYEEKMLNWRNSVEDKVPEREAHIHKKLFRKPDITDVNRWEKEMSNFEVITTEALIDNELIASGYSVKYSNWFWRPISSIFRIYYMVIFPVFEFLLRLVRYVKKKVLIS